MNGSDDGSISYNVDEEIGDPDMAVAIFEPNARTRVTFADEVTVHTSEDTRVESLADTEETDGAPAAGAWKKRRVPFEREEIEMRMPPGTRFYLRNPAHEDEFLQDLFAKLGESFLIFISLVKSPSFLLRPVHWPDITLIYNRNFY
jgi:hypothetical protein